MLTIRLLGPLVLARDGRRIRLPRKAGALIAYLTVRAEPIDRTTLSDLLWPHQMSEHARHSLRNCLLEVRKALGPEVVIGDFPTCRINADSIKTDIGVFRRLSQSADREQLRHACNLVRGPFLEGCDLAPEPWNEWLDLERERTRYLVSAAFTRLAQLSTETGEHDAAIDAASHLVALDPLDETAYRLLMKVLARAGRRTQALQQYRRLATTLREELCVAPEPETARLAAALTHY